MRPGPAAACLPAADPRGGPGARCAQGGICSPSGGGTPAHSRCPRGVEDGSLLAALRGVAPERGGTCATVLRDRSSHARAAVSGLSKSREERPTASGRGTVRAKAATAIASATTATTALQL